MSAHTPGPWMVHPSYKRTLYVIPAINAKRPVGGAADLEDDLNNYAQEVCALDSIDRHRSEEEMAANARLIAAAPELLAFVESFVSGFQPATFDPANDAWVKQARAAIAKATINQENING